MTTLPVTDDALQAEIATELVGQTGAGDQVFTPRTWRTPAALAPVLLVQSPSETKTNISGRTGPSDFWVTGVFRIVGRLYAKSGSGDAGAIAAQAALGTLKRQVEVALINSDTLRRMVQQFTSVATKSDIKSEGGLTFAEFEMDLTLEYIQQSEDFAQVPADPFTELAIYVDLVNLFSPSGDFTGSEPFTGTPAPRASGPDGRPEGKVLLEIPQP